MRAPLAADRVSCARFLRDEPSQLVEVSAEFEPGRVHVVAGAVGSGKNLLLRVLGLLETPDAGDVLIDGSRTRGLDPARRADLRNRRFGFVFAAPFLLPSFTVVENVAMPLFRLTTLDAREAQRRADRVLGFAGMADRAQECVEELSLEEQHRVSLARALVNQPDFLLAEDPATELEGLLRMAADELGATVIITADRPIAGVDRVLFLEQGALAAGAPR